MIRTSTIGEAAIAALTSEMPVDKVRISRQSAKAWFDGELAHEFPTNPPDRPGRPSEPELLLPKHMPRRRNIGRQANMVALLHAIAHIEFNAIDLAWDMVARFGRDMPRDFTDDWVQVADDESRHFGLLTERLSSYDAAYGDLPAHDGLWQSAMDTAHDLKARLAIVPLVLEARGLDVTPSIITRFNNANDQESSEALTIIYNDEINHVYAGQKWFTYLCDKEKIAPKGCYQELVRQYFSGHIKPPFNTEARKRAGLDEDFYLPLAVKL